MNHSSYEDYVDHVISVVSEEEDQDFIDVLREEITPLAEKYWQEYLIGERDSYQLSEEDVDSTWQSATIRLIENALAKLSDYGLIDTLIHKGGDIVYKISEDGEEYLKNAPKE
jgi:hypothetical protein